MGEGAERLMAAGIINMTIIILLITACLVPDPIDGFVVIQPGNQTVNRNVSASIRCEHTEDHGTIEDVRLNRLSARAGRSIACRLGTIPCLNIIGSQENSKTYVFILLNVGAEDMAFSYECEFTAKKDSVYDTRRGTPTRLLPGPKEASPSPTPPPPPPPPPPLLQLRWILIGLLALMFLYSCAITAIYIRLRVTRSQELNDSQTYVQMQRGREDPDVNSTYLEMRKATHFTVSHLAKEIRRDT